MTGTTSNKRVALTPDKGDAVALLSWVADPNTFVATDEAAATIREQVALSVKAGNAAMWNGSLFVYRAIESGEVGEGKRFADNGKVVAALGHKSRSYATLLRNLGEAISRHGIEFGSADWGHLCTAMMGSAEEDKVLRTTVRGNKAGFRKALTASKKAKVARDKAPKGLKGRGPNRQGGGKQTAGKGGKASTRSKPEAMSLGDALVEVERLRVWLNAASPTAAKRVEGQMLKAVKGSVDRRDLKARTIEGKVEKTA
jgi:hypothetical protein